MRTTRDHCQPKTGPRGTVPRVPDIKGRGRATVAERARPASRGPRVSPVGPCARLEAIASPKRVRAAPCHGPRVMGTFCRHLWQPPRWARCRLAPTHNASIWLGGAEQGLGLGLEGSGRCLGPERPSQPAHLRATRGAPAGHPRGTRRHAQAPAGTHGHVWAPAGAHGRRLRAPGPPRAAGSSRFSYYAVHRAQSPMGTRGHRWGPLGALGHWWAPGGTSWRHPWAVGP